jgi:hypothetical protein
MMRIDLVACKSLAVAELGSRACTCAQSCTSAADRAAAGVQRTSRNGKVISVEHARCAASRQGVSCYASTGR